ncbi:5-oxoprolinase subunit PxpB [Paraburkholderia sp.]|uniref:5-oxoprolinase subunit PxpB n=1 Tax=Paraburkholderia sp. TaxID=1926495 RepID=UPI00262AB8C1|nr:5-oxoprolinase subunit PxpB [Paraburkholderia sp.]
MIAAIPVNGEAESIASDAAAWTLHASGERLLIIELHAGDRVAANRRARDFAARIAAENLSYVTGIVPAMTTVGIHYAPHLVRLDNTSQAPYDALVEVLTGLLKTVGATQDTAPRVVEIPVCYGGEHGPDLGEVAHACGLSEHKVIELHSGALVDVMMLGFAPGHPYLGMLDARLSPARRATPRTAVAPGSIGLANRQSVIYPLTLPGGWNLIGRTPLALFDPVREAPCLVNAGDQVRFVPITPEQFETIRQNTGAAR